MWLETPPVDHDCHCTALFCFCCLSVPLCHRVATIKTKKRVWVFYCLLLPVSMAETTLFSVITWKHPWTHLGIWHSRIPLTPEPSRLTAGRGRNTNPNLHYTDILLSEGKTENQYVSLQISSDIFFEVWLRGNVSVTPGESGYWKPEAEESIDLDGKQSIPEKEKMSWTESRALTGGFILVCAGFRCWVCTLHCRPMHKCSFTYKT